MDELFLLISFSPLLYFALTTILNAFTFPRLHNYKSPITNPLITVLIPMRNEAAVIAETVRSWLAQDYPNFEILILDDSSGDDSSKIAREAAGGDSRLTIVQGNALPDGWLGKPWACHQLTTQARGEYLLFTDADVRWEPTALSALVAESQQTDADLLTVWPSQITQTWGERLVVPLMALTIQAYLPVLAVHHLPWPVFAHAMGQCLLFKREAYQQIGGHETVKAEVVDDMAFAYAIKRHNLRLRAADGNGLIKTRMYQNWNQVRDGFAKNILSGHGNSVAFLLLSTVFHWWMFIVPWVLVIGNWRLAIFGLLGILTRALTAAVTRQRVRDAILMPVSVVLMTVVAAQAVRWRLGGGGQWKGRRIVTKAQAAQTKPHPAHKQN
jgi:chlorobactene glucosyltransferase